MTNKDNITYETTKMCTDNWYNILDQFEDANIYQTCAFNKYSIGGKEAEQFIIKKNKEIVSAVIVRIKTLPIIKRGIAYVRWGPMWQPNEKEKKYENLSLALKYLYEEYVIKRKLYLQICPNIFKDKDASYNEIFIKEKFKHLHNIKAYRTFVLNLAPSLEEINMGFENDWRRRIKKAAGKNITIKQATDDHSYDNLIKLYRQTHSRKKFKEYVSIETFREIQKELKKKKKMKIFLGYIDKRPAVSFLISDIGKFGLALLGGTSKEGLKQSVTNVLHWEVIQFLKNSKKPFYDLGGIDPENNRSVYKFKRGSGADDISFIGEYYACKSILSKLIVNLKKIISSN